MTSNGEALPLQGHATQSFLTITSHNLIFYDFLAVINRVKWSQLCESKTKTNQEQNTLEAVRKQQDMSGTALGLYQREYIQTK